MKFRLLTLFKLALSSCMHVYGEIEGYDRFGTFSGKIANFTCILPLFRGNNSSR